MFLKSSMCFFSENQVDYDDEDGDMQDAYA